MIHNQNSLVSVSHKPYILSNIIFINHLRGENPMKKCFSAVVLLLFLVSFAFANEEIWFKGTFEQAKLKAKQESKLLIIDFYSDG